MTVSLNRPIPHGWGAASEFPWMRQGFAAIGTDPPVYTRQKVVFNYETGIGANRCHNNLSRPVEIHEIRVAATGAEPDPETGPPANYLLPNIAMRMGKTGQIILDEWTPVEALNHRDKWHSYGTNALATDAMVFELPTPYFLQRGAVFLMDLRTNQNRYGGPAGTRGRMLLHGYDEDGKAGTVSGNLAAIPEIAEGVRATFMNSPGGVSGIRPRDMMITHFSLSVYDFFTDINSEVDFSQYIEVRFRPNTGPKWVPSEDEWISLLGLAQAPTFPVVSTPLHRPIVLQPNEDFWAEIWLYTDKLVIDEDTDGFLVSVWAIGTQKGQSG